MLLSFPASSWQRNIPRNLMGSFGHPNSKGLVLFLLEVPIHKALVFFWFNRKPDNTPNEFTMLIAFLSDLVSSRMSVVSSGNCEILAFCPFGSSIPRQNNEKNTWEFLGFGIFHNVIKESNILSNKFFLHEARLIRVNQQGEYFLNSSAKSFYQNFAFNVKEG